MDVTCSRCGTSYEFEEGLVSTTGTTVKCTQCGHLFKVYRAESEPPPAIDALTAAGLKWRVRRVDGSTHTLESLGDLTRLIAAGQFQPDDEISRTGQVWRRLGDIAELSPRFEAAPRARRPSAPPPEAPRYSPVPPPPTVPSAIVEETSRTTPMPPLEAERPQRRTLPPEPRSEPSPAEVESVAEAKAESEVDLDAGTERRLPLTARDVDEQLGAATNETNESTIDTAPDAEPTGTVATNEIDQAIERQRRRGRHSLVVVALTSAALAGVAYGLFTRARTANAPVSPELEQPARDTTRQASLEADARVAVPASGRGPDTNLATAGTAPATAERAPAEPEGEPTTPHEPPLGRVAPSAPTNDEKPAGQSAEGDAVELCRRGEAALEHSAVKTAEHAFQQALALVPQMPRAQTGLGYVALERSQPELAAKYFKLAAKSGRGEAFIGLGDAYRRLGRLREALDAYQTYLKRHPNGSRTSIARRQVDLLQEQLGGH